MQALLWPIISWILREIVVKFVIFTALFAVLAFLIPKAIEYVSPWLGTGSLTGAFAGLGGGVWFFLDFFQLGYGVPLMISAGVTRFLIRRLPVSYRVMRRLLGHRKFMGAWYNEKQYAELMQMTYEKQQLGNRVMHHEEVKALRQWLMGGNGEGIFGHQKNSYFS